ncbi:MAG: tRNA-intron lyase [Halobacteria archaeon]|nr:tRNA-intron lyase [Halobacteria archaeon]
MKAELKDDRVVLGENARQRFYDSSGYGVPHESGSGLDLSLVEAAHLLYRGKLDSVGGMEFSEFLEHASETDRSFLPVFWVYKDLRERGYYLQHTPELGSALRLYSRGDTPATSDPETRVRVRNERQPLNVSELKDEELLGIVDEEGDITYFKVDEWDVSGGTKIPSSEGVTGHIINESVIVERPPGALYSSSFYGNRFDDRLRLSLVEAYDLVKRGILNIKGGPDISKIAGTDFDLKSRVYTDLRNRGVCPKTGFKFGTHFRVYETITNVNDLSHSEYLVHALPPGFAFDIPELSRAVRLAHGVRKTMVFALVDDTISYVSVRRYRP